MVRGLSEQTGEYAYNKFAYGYNSPAFEYPFVASVFGEDDSDANAKAERLFEKQCRLTYDENAKSFLHSPDLITLDARIYELIRSFEMEESDDENDWQRNKKKSTFSVDSRNNDAGSKKKVCFMTESIADLGGRQHITAILTSALADCLNLDISLFCTAVREKLKRWRILSLIKCMCLLTMIFLVAQNSIFFLRFFVI